MRILHPILIVSAIFMTSCRPQEPSSAPDNVVSRLCDHITKSRQKMIVDTNQAELVWSDGAILELGTNFPAPLEKLISNPTHYHDIRTSVRDLDARRRTEYQEAVLEPDTHHDRYLKITSKDGKIVTSVESLYVEYLSQKYPGGSFWIKGKFDPISFVVGGELRAAVMPVKF